MSKENEKFEMRFDFDGDTLEVRASLCTVEEVDKFIKVISAYKSLLPSKSASAEESDEDRGEGFTRPSITWPGGIVSNTGVKR